MDGLVRDLTGRCMTCSPTYPRVGWWNAPGTVPITANPSDRHRATAAVLVSTTALNWMPRNPAAAAHEARGRDVGAAAGSVRAHGGRAEHRPAVDGHHRVTRARPQQAGLLGRQVLRVGVGLARGDDRREERVDEGPVGVDRLTDEHPAHGSRRVLIGQPTVSPVSSIAKDVARDAFSVALNVTATVFPAWSATDTDFCTYPALLSRFE